MHDIYVLLVERFYINYRLFGACTFSSIDLGTTACCVRRVIVRPSIKGGSNIFFKNIKMAIANEVLFEVISKEVVVLS
jgi:hypothetical protein